MLKYFKLFFFLIISQSVFCQYTWQWTELASMPFNTSNNAVCEADVNGSKFVYSFGGIDDSKIYSGIHNRSFKYDVNANTWSEIDLLPDPEPKIAAGASFVKGKIYIIGGYHVYANNSEVSSSKVHVYNPSTDLFEADATDIPLAIDDHVQCVYKDSLIFVVTGWSNNGNKPNVQIFNPELNAWSTGTSLINDFYYTAFGASGYILGDTLYYHGGAAGSSFAARSYLRKGYINPNDPTDITWSLGDNSPGDAGYRAACSGVGNTVFWVGGSATSYNFDGIAYSNGVGVEPETRILHYNNWSHSFVDETNEPYGVMDLRGIAKISEDKWIICGGMDSSQVVGNRTFLLENSLVEIGEKAKQELRIFQFEESVVIDLSKKQKVKLFDLQGKCLEDFKETEKIEIKRSKYKRGVYLLHLEDRIVRILL